MSSQSQNVVTRFAPSPTGFLHIGGARTALFNWAFARHHGGSFLLRIEDTDRKRSTQTAIDAIIDGMEWLGMSPDGEIVYQHKQAERHIAITRELLGHDNAYKCYCTAEELDKMREDARAARRFPKYEGTCRNRDPSEAVEGAAYVIRFKAPQTDETIIQDAVHGRVVIANEQLDDLILLRSDGTPTYMLSVVVDDYDMGVTHVIRGDDHLTNAARQIQIYHALHWTLPVFAHIPLIHGSDGAKLSKRHGALGVDAYREMGYLPAAMRNYLARLGWSHGDDELFSTHQLIDWFDINAIGKSPARFDMDKLDHVNAHHISEADDLDLIAEVISRNPDYQGQADKLAKAMPYLKVKTKGLNALTQECAFVVAKLPLEIEEKLQKALNADSLPLLVELVSLFEKADDWSHDALETCLSAFMEAKGINMGKIGPALRACLTGTTKSLGIYDVLVLLGKQESIKRIYAKIT